MKKVKMASMVAALGLAMISGNASAGKDMNFGMIYIGCGLGGMIGGAVDNKTASTILAVSTNITWDLGTTASISYFSSEDTCYNKKAVVAAFIQQSYEILEKEIAMGKGEYFDTLAVIAADDPQSVAEYQSNLRKQFATIVADDAYTQLSRYEKVKNLYDVAI